MRGSRWTFSMCMLWCLSALVPTRAVAVEEPSKQFQEILELAGIGPEALAQLEFDGELSLPARQAVISVLSRMDQFRDMGATLELNVSSPDGWFDNDSDNLGRLYRVAGHVVSCKRVDLPDGLEEVPDKGTIYRCALLLDGASDATRSTVEVLTRGVPNAWKTREKLREPVELRGALIRLGREREALPPLLVTNRLAWFPTDNAPTGQLLLARQGMDVGLFDEVVHRQPFVKSEVSREGEAFYAGLKALRDVDSIELVRLAKENVGRVANLWKSLQPELREQHRQAERELAELEDDSVREQLEKKLRRARTRRDLATTIAQQAAAGQSSVATMFLQPEREVGELYIFEGTARRAIRIPVENEPGLTAYYEVEIYPIESRLLKNRPIVCCVTSLPEGFPQGDIIREPVRIAGAFFKYWRYRSRNLDGEQGETDRATQLYTPVLLGQSPTWLRTSYDRSAGVALWGGIGFLIVLAALWTSMAWLSRRDRRARQASRPNETIDL